MYSMSSKNDMSFKVNSSNPADTPLIVGMSLQQCWVYSITYQ